MHHVPGIYIHICCFYYLLLEGNWVMQLLKTGCIFHCIQDVVARDRFRQNTDPVVNFGRVPLAGAICRLCFKLPVLWSWQAQHVGADKDVIFVSDDDEDVIRVRGWGTLHLNISKSIFCWFLWHKINFRISVTRTINRLTATTRIS